MALHQMTGLTPHLTAVDLEQLRGHRVLGEPLEVLMSAALRLRFTPVGGGGAQVDFVMAADEADALTRAMSRVNLPESVDERDVRRVVEVVTQACRATDAVIRQILAQPA